MKLRTAIKICNEVYGFRMKNMYDRFDIKRTYDQVQKAKRICKRKWQDERIPYIPSDEEEIDRAETIGCIFLDLLKLNDVSEEEIEKKKEEFLVEIDKCRTQ